MLNDVGRMIQTVWDEIPVYYPGIDVDAFVVMPNHIYRIVGRTPCQPENRLFHLDDFLFFHCFAHTHL